MLKKHNFRTDFVWKLRCIVAVIKGSVSQHSTNIPQNHIQHFTHLPKLSTGCIIVRKIIGTRKVNILAVILKKIRTKNIKIEYNKSCLVHRHRTFWYFLAIYKGGSLYKSSKYTLFSAAPLFYHEIHQKPVIVSRSQPTFDRLNLNIFGPDFL